MERGGCLAIAADGAVGVGEGSPEGLVDVGSSGDFEMRDGILGAIEGDEGASEGGAGADELGIKTDGLPVEGEGGLGSVELLCAVAEFIFERGFRLAHGLDAEEGGSGIGVTAGRPEAAGDVAFEAAELGGRG